MYSIIKIKGKDRLELLQGLVSTDVTTQQNHKTCFCDAKGRVLADALLIHQEHFLLTLVHTSVTHIIINHINHYKILADVNCSIEPYTLSTQTLTTQNIQVQFLDSLPLTLTPSKNTLDQLDETWHQSRYKNNYIGILKSTSGLFLPQSLGYDLFDMVSLKKGCYLGQEVLARLTRLGTLKRKLYLLEANQSSIGSKLYYNEKAIGTIVDNQKNACYAVLNQSPKGPLTTSLGETTAIIKCLLP